MTTETWPAGPRDIQQDFFLYSADRIGRWAENFNANDIVIGGTHPAVEECVPRHEVSAAFRGRRDNRRSAT
jgi:hypothetical protein